MSRIQRIVWTGATAFVAAGLGLSGLVWHPEAERRRPITVEAAQTAVCPTVDPARVPAIALAAAQRGDVTLQELSGGSARRAVAVGDPVRVERPAAPLRLELAPGATGGGSVLTAATTGLERGLALSSCAPAATSTWFVGLASDQTTTSDLTLTNTDAAAASVDLDLYGATGRLASAGSRSVEVKANSTLRVALGPLVRSSEPIGVHVVATQGRVAASVRTRTYVEGETSGTGVEWIAPATEPRGDLVVAVPVGAGRRQLVLTNPGQRATDVTLELLTPGGPVTSDALRSITLGPESTTSLTVDSLVLQRGGYLRLRSPQPVTAALRAAAAEVTSDPGIAAASRPFAGTVVVPLTTVGLAGSLLLGNPLEAPARARVTQVAPGGKELSAKEVTLAPGSSTALDVEATASVVVRIEVLDGQLAGAISLRAPSSWALPSLALLPLRGDSTGEVVVEPRRVPGYASES